jgi:hypothetical protein
LTGLQPENGVTRGTDKVSTSKNNWVCSFNQQLCLRRHTMTERTPQGFNVMLQSVRECRLTKNQVFRLWKCAVKDDDKLVDAVIEKLYEEMIAFDLARAETVMQLIIDRDEAAVPTFRNLLQDIATGDLPKTDKSRCHCASPTQHLQELGVPRELIRPITSIIKTSDRAANA